MAENSKIEWTDHTFNPWTGCTAVSPACDHCYAEGWAKRSGHVRWGAHAERRRTTPATWGKPLQWNRAAKAEGVRRKVFCASLADIFDNHRSIQPDWRQELWELIRSTAHLDWLLLTKRPQNFARYLPDTWGNGWSNVWLGTTVENQTEAERRIPHLLRTPSRVRFLSCEPLLGPLRLDDVVLDDGKPGEWHVDCLDAEGGDPADDPDFGCNTIDWVICGGESGHGARPMHLHWARSIRDQCQAASVPFHFKQWGDWHADALLTTDTEGNCPPPKMKIGKKSAGRLLDGREWNEAPA